LWLCVSTAAVPIAHVQDLLLCAVTLHFTLRRKAITSSTSQGSGLGKQAACLPLMCWLSVAVAGGAIAFL
jgi:hypothetical protein